MSKFIKYLLTLVIIITPLVILHQPLTDLAHRYLFNRQPVSIEPSSPQLPSGWTITNHSDNQISLSKANSNLAITPTIVWTSRTIDITTTPSEYVDDLKSGATLTIPSLKYTDDITISSDDNHYSRRLEGYYTNSGNKIHLIQLISLQSGQVTTLTGSYLGDISTAAEIEQVFDYLN